LLKRDIILSWSWGEFHPVMQDRYAILLKCDQLGLIICK